MKGIVMNRNTLVEKFESIMNDLRAHCTYIDVHYYKVLEYLVKELPEYSGSETESSNLLSLIKAGYAMPYKPLRSWLLHYAQELSSSNTEEFPEGSLFTGSEGTSCKGVVRFGLGRDPIRFEIVQELVGISHRIRKVYINGDCVADDSYSF